jgi:hypothetical protein
LPWPKLFLVLVAVGLTVSFIQDPKKLEPGLNYLTEYFALRELAQHDDAAKRWREQLQTSVAAFPFSQEAAEHIEPLLRLSENPDPKIRCTANLRLSTAYLVANQPEKAGLQLQSAISNCEQDPAVMEELYYLSGRVKSEKASRKEHPEEVRRVYETLAWKDYDEAWLHGEQQRRDFAVVAVLQMCLLSKRRLNLTTAELRKLEFRVDEAMQNPLAVKNNLMSYLIQQGRVIISLRVTQEVAEARHNPNQRPAAPVPGDELQQLDQTTGPAKSLKDIDKPNRLRIH